LNMLEISAREAAQRFPGKRGAILATTGTLSTGLYDRALAAAGVDTVVPDEAQRKTLMYLIYDVVKASRPLREAAETWAGLLDELRGRGADYFILGCTELPILADNLDAPGPFIDPTAELAAAAIRFCGYEVKE
ncbi:MAG: amino acid racemase, partial [Oscillospiraceae bacterium]|nr:amino acid racemase [Oscillospiraceae bacterium]